MALTSVPGKGIRSLWHGLSLPSCKDPGHPAGSWSASLLCRAKGILRTFSGNTFAAWCVLTGPPALLTQPVLVHPWLLDGTALP